MKLKYDGFAMTPKLCIECECWFIFEWYVKYTRTFSPCCSGTVYVCKECMDKKQLKTPKGGEIDGLQSADTKRQEEVGGSVCFGR